ncbi:restriction endonuclease [Kitasatospora aureofaciens]|uniref:restriction endonuclease n=1 Tax=Kitasatospora aureofaciens TaxID=1894 RepID=UPI0036F4524D
MIIQFEDADQSTHDRLTVVARQVRPLRYRSRELRRSVGDFIGRAGHDELLAGALWIAEGRAARTVIDDMAEWETALTGEIGRRERDLQNITRASVQHEAKAAVNAALAVYRRELAAISAARILAETAFEQLRDRFGGDVACLFTRDRSDSPAEEVFEQWTAAEQSIDQVIEEHDALETEVDRLSAIAGKREAFASTEHSVPQGKLEHLDGQALEHLIARLLQRDGLTLLRATGGPGDQGVDLIAQTPHGTRIAVQSKFRQRGPIGPRVVYELNGTARQLHGADIAVVVTNQHFSDQTIQDARTLGVHLVDGHLLSLWATWGDTVHDILGTGPTTAADLPELSETDTV